LAAARAASDATSEEVIVSEGKEGERGREERVWAFFVVASKDVVRAVSGRGG
jgi:hypothetical protein